MKTEALAFSPSSHPLHSDSARDFLKLPAILQALGAKAEEERRSQATNSHSISRGRNKYK